MHRRLAISLALLLFGIAGAEAQTLNPITKIFIIGTGGSCATTACSGGTRQMCRNSTTSHVLYACDTSTGFYVDVGSIDSGARLNLEGAAGDTYFLRDPDTGCVQEWKDGVLGWQWCAQQVVPPDCPADVSGFPFGGMCKDQATRRLKVKALAVEAF